MSHKSEKIAVIYCRVSSIKQTKVGDGLDSQKARCAEYARGRGYAVVATFEDDRSGGLIDRPGMKALLAFLKKHRASSPVVIIDDISRLARGVEAHIKLRGAIALAGGVLESPTVEFGDGKCPDFCVLRRVEKSGRGLGCCLSDFLLTAFRGVRGAEPAALQRLAC